MSAKSRRKGIAGEREVAARMESAGWEVRGLEGGGDWLAFRHRQEVFGGIDMPLPSWVAHVEVKRYHDRARFPEWWEQAVSEAIVGVRPLLCTRADRGEWLVTLRLDDLLEMVS